MKFSLAEVQSAVASAIDELNQSRPADRQIGKSDETVLYGAGSVMDSLGLVNLIVSIESAVGERFGVAITLADEKAMSLRNSPFRSVGTLGAYVHQLVNEAE